MERFDCLVIGAGVYGAATALTLRRSGYRVGLFDPGPIPHPLAASTDISKAVRMEYGDDAEYTALVDEAIDGWHAWNDQFGETLYHEVGVTMLTRQPLQPGDFEYESLRTVRARGHAPERLDADEIARRFPAWKPGAYVDGFFHARGGFAESGRVVETLCRQARREGVLVWENRPVRHLLRHKNRVTAATTADGDHLHADHYVVCAGAWTPLLVPELQTQMRATGHPVFHLQVPDPDLFMPPSFAVFTADVTRTGWYGFPLHPGRHVLKIANHGVGKRVHPRDDERVVTGEDRAALRAMLAETFPTIADAPIVYTRRCLYNDTLDEHLWIDRHPAVENLTVGAGGSGHAFKMAPVLGELVADAVLGGNDPRRQKFRWRELHEETTGQEAARYHG